MACIKKAFSAAYLDMARKGWTPRLYVFVDIHSTVLEPTYKEGCKELNFYPKAKEALQLLSKREDIVLTYYSCTPLEQCKEQSEIFEGHDIMFDYHNENPEITNADTKYGCYLHKPYFNVLLDDKAGFEPDVDWQHIIDFYNGYE